MRAVPVVPKMNRGYYMAYVCGGHHWWNEAVGVNLSALGWLQRRGDTCRLRGAARA